MTVAELIELLKTLPQDYVVKSGTVNTLSVYDLDLEIIPGSADSENKIVIL